MPPRQAASALVATLSLAACAPAPATYWDLHAAALAESLGYDELLTAHALQGLANQQRPTLFFDTGARNYDWPAAESWWRAKLEADGRVRFTEAPPTLCGLIAAAPATRGLVVYAAAGDFGDGYSAAIALTLASQRGLLPVADATLRRHACLRALPLAVDLRLLLAGKSRTQAWEWALATLLPHAARDVVVNLNRYRASEDPWREKLDPQDAATVHCVDYAVQRRAFVVDLEPRGAARRGADDALLDALLSRLDPLFDAFGWAAEEFTWVNATSAAGGAVLCSFASPNLSFWALVPCDRTGRREARRLPAADRGVRLDRAKHYVTFETNEGDTPRILVSAMASSWASARRGSLPVAWAIDPLLAERFPALFDHFAATATPNDSFVAATAGAGYAMLDQFSAPQLDAYAARVGRLLAAYGPSVVDSYGYANLSTMQRYAAAAAAGGGAPSLFVSQPNWDQRAYAPYHCAQDNMWLPDGTPVVCSSYDPQLFYYKDGLIPFAPAEELALRIRRVAEKHAPPFFILVYGGLSAFGNPLGKSGGPLHEGLPWTDFWSLIQKTMQHLGDDFVAVGATELARLAREAQLVPSA